MIWRLLSAILLLAFACLATPTISGWPVFLEGLDEEVEPPTWEWWEVVERAAVVCKYPPALSSLRITIIAHNKHLPAKLVSQGLFIWQSAEVLTEVQPQPTTGSFRIGVPHILLRT